MKIDKQTVQACKAELAAFLDRLDAKDVAGFTFGFDEYGFRVQVYEEEEAHNPEVVDER